MNTPLPLGLLQPRGWGGFINLKRSFTCLLQAYLIYFLMHYYETQNVTKKSSLTFIEDTLCHLFTWITSFCKVSSLVLHSVQKVENFFFFFFFLTFVPVLQTLGLIFTFNLDFFLSGSSKESMESEDSDEKSSIWRGGRADEEETFWHSSASMTAAWLTDITRQANLAAFLQTKREFGSFWKESGRLCHLAVSGDGEISNMQHLWWDSYTPLGLFSLYALFSEIESTCPHVFFMGHMLEEVICHSSNLKRTNCGVSSSSRSSFKTWF